MPSPSPSVPPAPCPFIDALSPDPCFAGGVQVGDNNLAGTEPGSVLGQDLDDAPESAQVCWDNDLSDGFDSGWVSVQLVGEVGGGTNGVTWTLIQPDGTHTALNYSGVTYTTIDQVQISAVVSAPNMKISWRSVQAGFYQNGNLVDVVTLPDECAPQADTTGPGAPSSASEFSELVPNGGGNTKVVVTAMVRLQSPQTTLPASNAMSGAICVYAEDCESE